jgi:hypothetical protein
MFKQNMFVKVRSTTDINAPVREKNPVHIYKQRWKSSVGEGYKECVLVAIGVILLI